MITPHQRHTAVRLADGWLVIPYTGSERAEVSISVEPDIWLPAFLDYDDNQRVAKIRPPAGPGLISVKLRVDGVVSPAGSLRLLP